MSKEEIIMSKIKQQGFLPLFFYTDKHVCINVVKTMYDAGVTVIEFTNRGENALENFKAIAAVKKHSMPNLLLAAGTIKTVNDANDFIAAGADFLISPMFDKEICDAAHAQKILWAPGCMTPTEIHTAQKAGCTFIKLFPGNILGPGFLSGIKELFSGIDFMPTGGVDATKESIGAWFNAGVCAVGMGSKLIDKKIVVEKNYELLTQRIKAIQVIIEGIKN